MESMILDGINVLKCDIKFQSCWDEMPVINFAIPTSQVWATLLPFGVELLIWQVYYQTDTSCCLCNFGILSSQYIRYCKIRLTGVWQSHLGDRKTFHSKTVKIYIPTQTNHSEMCKLSKWKCGFPVIFCPINFQWSKGNVSGSSKLGHGTKFHYSTNI